MERYSNLGSAELGLHSSRGSSQLQIFCVQLYLLLLSALKLPKSQRPQCPHSWLRACCRLAQKNQTMANVFHTRAVCKLLPASVNRTDKLQNRREWTARAGVIQELCNPGVRTRPIQRTQPVSNAESARCKPSVKGIKETVDGVAVLNTSGQV